jgi:hypothetical protein
VAFSVGAAVMAALVLAALSPVARLLDARSFAFASPETLHFLGARHHLRMTSTWRLDRAVGRVEVSAVGVVTRVVRGMDFEIPAQVLWVMALSLELERGANSLSPQPFQRRTPLRIWESILLDA